MVMQIRMHLCEIYVAIVSYIMYPIWCILYDVWEIFVLRKAKYDDIVLTGKRKFPMIKCLSLLIVLQVQIIINYSIKLSNEWVRNLCKILKISPILVKNFYWQNFVFTNLCNFQIFSISKRIIHKDFYYEKIYFP